MSVTSDLSLRSAASPTGVGLGLRGSFIAEVDAGVADGRVPFFEISPENHMRRGGARPARLARIRERFPVLTHGLSMSLGGLEPLDPDYFAELRQFLAPIGEHWHSDHICFCGTDGKQQHDLNSLKAVYTAPGPDLAPPTISITAPADGTVVMVVDGIPDNKPGQVDFYYRLGNSVVISLGSGEYVHLCHLQTGSMQVRVGDKITRGQVVAKCGNSGNSTVPHLHFQLSDGQLVSHAASLPAYFSGVHKDGVRQDLLLPLSGDRLTQPDPKPPAAISSAPTPARPSEDPQGN